MPTEDWFAARSFGELAQSTEEAMFAGIAGLGGRVCSW